MTSSTRSPPTRKPTHNSRETFHSNFSSLEVGKIKAAHHRDTCWFVCERMRAYSSGSGYPRCALCQAQVATASERVGESAVWLRDDTNFFQQRRVKLQIRYTKQITVRSSETTQKGRQRQVLLLQKTAKSQGNCKRLVWLLCIL